jgi:hypothetical protein
MITSSMYIYSNRHTIQLSVWKKCSHVCLHACMHEHKRGDDDDDNRLDKSVQASNKNR